MKNKGSHFTVVVIPHTGESVLSWRIPLFLVQLAGVLVVVCIIIACVCFNTCQKFQDEHAIADKLWDENRLLSEQLDLLTLTTEDLLSKVEQIERLGDEVRIIADLPPLDKPDNPSARPTIPLAGSTPRVLAGRGGNPVVERTVLNVVLLQEILTRRAEEMTLLKGEVLEHRQKLEATPSLWPVKGVVTSEFGPRRSPFTGRKEFHEGIDLAAPRGTSVQAAAAGRVKLAQRQRGIGNVVILEHQYGYQTLYGHLSGFAVGPGDTVVKGQPIGYVGNTGASTGPHLHYTVFVHGVAVNPRDYLP